MAIAYQSDKGPKRSDNQDAVGAFYNRSGDPLVLVADGVASQKGSKKAAQLVIQTLGRAWEQVTFSEDERVKEWLIHQADLANQAILLVGEHDEGRSQMATTLVVAVCLPNRILVANAGDSRAYLLRRHEAKQLTFDHTLKNELERQSGQRVSENIPEGDSLTRYLGVNRQVDLEWTVVTPQVGDWLYLTSDGLSKVLTLDEQLQILQPGIRRPGNQPALGSALDTAERLAALTKAAIMRSVPDNVTSLLVTNLTEDEQDGRKQQLTKTVEVPKKATEVFVKNGLKGRLD
ncbi:Serine/threonine protein phosphatase PrpC (PTC1) [Fructobacillus fructosus]|uniref:PP2C family protein-serine/threonine phosphatase n=1 Tax=Fructobacillus fructosus TaxID=1631 RepID=UPI002D858E59|nr:Serine/threonine protein phosphatase PrpC (PTC1) [Fructobacillus fructosus]